MDKHARLTVFGRGALAKRVLGEGLTLKLAATGFNVSAKTAGIWRQVWPVLEIGALSLNGSIAPRLWSWCSAWRRCGANAGRACGSLSSAKYIITTATGPCNNCNQNGALLASGSLEFTVPRGGEVDISAYGTQDYSVDPLMRVTVNGVVAGTWDVGAAQTLALNQSVPQGDPATYYTIGDQVGTAQLELSSGGWPVWRGEFGPYGQEYDSETTENKFKFTGKERDTESGLDYFGARYYASSMGRWMSPDWADKPEAVPYSDLDNPQSLNLYDYVNNNPLSKADPDGHCCWDKAKQWVTEHPRTSQAVGGVAKVAVGVGLVATIAGGDVPGSVVGVGMVVSGTLSAVGSVVSGVTDVAGAATNTNVEAAQKGLDGVSNVPALVTSAATGNLAAGAAVGTLADAGQLAAKPMEALKNPATMADAAKTVSSAVDLGKSAASAVHNTLSPGPPPAPKPPAPPSCSTAGACK